MCGRRVLERVVNVGLYCLFGCVFISRLERVLGSYDIVLRGVVV